MSPHDDPRLPQACRRLRRRLDALVTDSLDAAEREWADEHLLACEGCFEALSEELGAPAETTAEAPALESAILQRLGVDPCTAALERLENAATAGTGLERALLEQHLAGCPGCSAVASALDRLQLDLPGLCELEPDPGFTADVLRATVASRPARAPRPHLLEPWLTGLQRWWRRVQGRPRFAMEAAYAISLLLFALTRADHLVLTALEQGRSTPARVSSSLSQLTSALDHRVDTLGTELYRAVDGSIAQSSGAIRNALDAAATLEPGAADPSAEAPDEDLAAASPDAGTSHGWLPRLLGIRPWQEPAEASDHSQQPDDLKPDHLIPDDLKPDD